MTDKNAPGAIFLRKILEEKLISEGKLRNITSSGIPDNCGLRGVLWRVLLRYLPLDTTSWSAFLVLHRGAYEGYKELFFHRPPTSDPTLPLEHVARASDIMHPASSVVYLGR